ncbi:MAG: gamma carbonic anhydrase family protein [Candidatus Abyssobacteria bacterium SURF_17]|uniref:Gamma carbonic anhydrase family protein n=1 Tax=Candidatus Abyssobacteria bacterium SURF_17 TaxID=2093361 RepID=A0A419EV04_9BACT|nr:MAG: gamma carbonic anhydrase family protein [Candidatus Abyssubacteria bacterium SURF_17]
MLCYNKDLPIKPQVKPEVHSTAFIANGAQLWDDVVIGPGASVWFGAVLRGDEGKIIVGENTNIQDNCVVHSDLGMPVVIGSNVTIGHGTVLRACEIGDDTMVGMNATIMSGASIGRNCVVGAHSLITYNQHFGDDSLIMGVPARRIRQVNHEERQFSRVACEVYRNLVEDYSSGRIKTHPFRK